MMRVVTTGCGPTAFLFTLIALLVLPAVMAGPAWADLVVVRASGGGLKVGQTVPTGTTVTLPEGANATLLSQDGRTVALTGPFSGVPEARGVGAGDPKVVSALSRLLTAGAADTSSLGVTRGVHVPEPLAIDPEAGGTYCQLPDRTPVFKRGLALGAARVTITTATGNETVVSWPAGQAALSWPAEVPLIDGVYLLQLDNRPEPARLTVRRLPNSVAGPAEAAVWMADHGCKKQALALLNSLQ